MSRDLDLEQRYRRVLRLLPGYYREQWEEDMVATLLDGWLTGDPEADKYVTKAARPATLATSGQVGLQNSRMASSSSGSPVSQLSKNAATMSSSHRCR